MSENRQCLSLSYLTQNVSFQFYSFAREFCSSLQLTNNQLYLPCLHHLFADDGHLGYFHALAISEQRSNEYE